VQVDGCAGVTVWDFWDPVSWIPGVFPGEGSGTLYFPNFDKHPAYQGVVDALTNGTAPVCNADNCLRAFRASSIAGRLDASQAFCSTFTKTVVTDVSVLPAWAPSACAGDVMSRASSACACLPKATS
jgi:hypothetical protein